MTDSTTACLINHQNMTGTPLPMDAELIASFEESGMIIDLETGKYRMDPDRPDQRTLAFYQMYKRRLVGAGWIFTQTLIQWHALAPDGSAYNHPVLTGLLDLIELREIEEMLAEKGIPI